MSRPNLTKALLHLSKAAERAGVDPAAAREDAAMLAAAVAESNRGAYLDWCLAFDHASAAAPFFDAAVRGRRFRTQPTPTAREAGSGSEATAYRDALAEICHGAARLGEPGPGALHAAASAAAAQVGAPTPLAGSALPVPDAAAQQEFARNAPAILTDVLSRLNASSQQLSSHNQQLLDLSRLDPGLPGAIAGFTPATTPAPGQPPVAAAPPPAESQVAEALPEPEAPAEPEKSVEEWLAELDALVGLARVKSEIHRQTAILKVDAMRTKAGLKSPTITRHLIFTGNPGTGKTTVARMVAGIYQAIGLLSTGQLIEVDRSELVAGYLGQTAMKTAEVVKSAMGGVLFIDEAYALNGDQYGEEAINTLVKEMEDNRDDLVVIVAGYPQPMQVFISQNPGLASRFRTEIPFDNYTDEELGAIFTQMADKADYDLSDGALAEFTRQLTSQTRDESFGNGRFARNVLEAAIGHHAWRLRDEPEPTLEQLRSLLPEDLTLDPQPPVEWDPTGSEPGADEPSGEQA